MAVTQLPSVTPLLLFVCLHMWPTPLSLAATKLWCTKWCSDKKRLSTSTDTFLWWSLAIALKEPRHNCDGFSSLCNLDYVFWSTFLCSQCHSKNPENRDCIAISRETSDSESLTFFIIFGLLRRTFWNIFPGQTHLYSEKVWTRSCKLQNLTNLCFHLMFSEEQTWLNTCASEEETCVNQSTYQYTPHRCLSW